MKKLCIVVGLGKGGIGDAIAYKFGAQGYNVALIARSDLTHLEPKIPNSKSYRCDASDPLQVTQTVNQIRTDFATQQIHALMYNAGSGSFKPFEQTTYDEFMKSIQVGPAGIFLWTKTCLPYMPTFDGASIGITGATASWRGMPMTPAFAPSKMATRGLAQALARDFGPNKGIHVFHVIIDGLVNLQPPDNSGQQRHPMLASKQANEIIDPNEIGNIYWMLHNQPPICWTQETHVAAQGAFGSIASI